jgi:hypothetical protein
VPAGDLGRSEDVVEGREDRGVHAGRSGIRRLADAALLGREPADELGALVHDRHELGARADVFGGHVGAAERLDRVAEIEHGVACARLVEGDPRGDRDHGLAAAARETGCGVLQRHRLREAEGVGEGVGPVPITPEPGAAESLAEPRRVHGDDDGEAGARTVGDEHAFVLRGFRRQFCADLGRRGRGMGDRHRSFSLFNRLVSGTGARAS